jgi:hypothetical protein
MKKIFLVGGILLTTTTATFAQNNYNPNDAKEIKMNGTVTRKEIRKDRRAENRNEVSSITKSQFAQDFPGAMNAQFEKTSNFDEVSFMSGRKKLKAYYDYNDVLVGTTQQKGFSDIPKNAQNKILQKYPDYTVVEVIKYVDNSDNDTDIILYGTTFDDVDGLYVELKNNSKTKLVRVDRAGFVSYLSDIK